MMRLKSPAARLTDKCASRGRGTSAMIEQADANVSTTSLTTG